MSSVATAACSIKPSSDTFCHADATRCDKQHAKHLLLPSSYPHKPAHGWVARRGWVHFYCTTRHSQLDIRVQRQRRNGILVVRKETLRGNGILVMRKETPQQSEARL